MQKLRARIGLLLLLVLGAFTMLAVLLHRWIIQPAFTELERRAGTAAILRVEQAIRRIQVDFGEAAALVAHRVAEEAPLTLSPALLRDLDAVAGNAVSWVALADGAGDLRQIYRRAPDGAWYAGGGDALALWRGGLAAVFPEGARRVVAGALPTAEGPAMIGAMRLPTGDAADWVLVGALFNAGLAHALSDVAGGRVEVIPTHEAASRPAVVGVLEALRDDPVAYAQSGERAGMAVTATLLLDLLAERSLLLAVSLPRSISTLGTVVLRQAFVVLVGVGVVAVLTVLLLFEHKLMGRIGALSGDVRRIAESRNLSRRVTRHDDDEIGELAGIVNRMLESLHEAEQIVRAGEQRYRVLFENAHDGFLLIRDGRIVDANDTAVRMFRYAGKGDLIGREPQEIAPGLSDRSRQAVLDSMRKAGGGAFVTFEWELNRADGSGFDAEVRLARLADAEGALLGVVQDISERKEAEKALRESEDRLDLAVDGAGLGLWDHDVATGTLVVNERWSGMLGYAPGEVGATLTDWEALIHPEDRAATRDAVRQHLGGLSPQFEAQYRMRTRAGDWRWVLARGRVVQRDAEGRPLRVAGTHLDITDRLVAEERYRMLFEEMLTGFALHELLCDADGRPVDYRFLEVNPAFESLTGLRAEDAVVRTVTELLPGVEPLWLDRYSVVAQTGQPARFEGYAASLQRWFDCTAFSPAPGQFAVIFADVTERRRAEEDRRRLEAQIQQGQKLESLGILAGGIAHDFNNLLMGIMGNADLALEEIPPETFPHNCLREIETASRRAADLCRQMLAYSGKGQFSVQAANLNDLIGEMSDLLRVSVPRHIELRRELAPDLPLVDVDATQIRQVLMNLIINAAEAIGEESGAVVLRTSFAPCDRAYLDACYLQEPLDEGVYVVLSVTDSGCGMSPEVRERIFDPFFTTKFTGRGLGLAAVLGIVRGHRGAIRIYTEPGQGTNFTILLPASPVAPDARAVGTEEAHVAAPLPEGATVLLVDDEEHVLRVGTRMLERLGLRVLTAADGQQAVRRFQEEAGKIDGVLLDITMPNMNGIATCRALHAVDPAVPVVLSSGFNETDVVAKAADLRVAGFIQKPYELARLRVVLGAALARVRSG